MSLHAILTGSRVAARPAVLAGIFAGRTGLGGNQSCCNTTGNDLISSYAQLATSCDEILNHTISFALRLSGEHVCTRSRVYGPRQIGDPRRFDEWGDIPFSDEKARLDNIAIHLEHEPDLIVYLVIFAGRRACVGEAQARGIRAKNYLVRKRGINPERVIWIDGGFRDEVTTEISLWPPQVGKPSVFPEFNLKPSEVKLERNCRIKYRGYKALKN